MQNLSHCCCEVLFNHLFRNPADPGGKAGESGRIHDRFHQLVVRHREDVNNLLFFKSKTFRLVVSEQRRNEIADCFDDFFVKVNLQQPYSKNSGSAVKNLVGVKFWFHIFSLSEMFNPYDRGLFLAAVEAFQSRLAFQVRPFE